MILRTIGLGAACLALAAESIMIPPTVSLPGLTEESLHRHGDAHEHEKTNHDNVQALPMDDWIEKMKDLNLGVSKPLPSASDDVLVVDLDFDDLDFDDLSNWTFLSEDDDDDDDEFFKWPMIGEDEDDEDDDDDHKFVFDFDFDVKGLDTQDDQESCPSGSSLKAFICRVRNTVADKIEDVKPYFQKPHRRPCPKKLAAMAKAKADEALNHPPIKGGIAKFWPYFHPTESMPSTHNHLNSHHHYHHHENKFAKVLHKICTGLRVFVTGFLIPVLIGVAAGMTASLLGMCVGTFLAWCWIKLVRGGKRGNASGRVMLVEADACEAAAAEKDGLLKGDSDSEDAPPTYVERE